MIEEITKIFDEAKTSVATQCNAKETEGKPAPGDEPEVPGGTAVNGDYGSCNSRVTDYTCVQYTGAIYFGQDAVHEQACDGDSTWIPTLGCPSADLGVCTLAPGTANELKTSYYSGYDTNAGTACTANGGTWVPGT